MSNAKQRNRLAIAKALLNASRPLVLADNPLLDEPAVRCVARARYPDGVLAEELALGDLVREAAQVVQARMGNDPRLLRERAVLESVLDGGSVWAAARALGISREHLSNSSWRTVSLWVLEAFSELCAASARREDARPRTGSRISVLS